ncbi:hypothetical protein OH77DRAFT_1524839 [Trametes cingulata]|nr:hypothetical protein OH77DRAFT_1524839 [Trametes cingulata]
MNDSPSAHFSLTACFLDFVADTNSLDDPAPFCYDAWRQNITKEFPPWSPFATQQSVNFDDDQREAIRAFVAAYCATDKRAAFLAAAQHNNHADARRNVQDWLKKATGRWALNAKLEAGLEEAGITIFNSSVDKDQLDNLIPTSMAYSAIDHLMDNWLGYEGQMDNRARMAGHRFFRGLISLTWNRWRGKAAARAERIKKAEKNLEDIRKHIEQLEADAKERGEENFMLPMADAKRYHSALEELVTQLGGWAETVRSQQATEAREELEEMRATIIDDDEKPPLNAAKLPRSLRRALENIPSKREAEVMHLKITELLEALDSEGINVQLKPVNYSEWSEGVEEYKHLTIEDIAACFALKEPRIPIFAEKTDNVGNEDPWSPVGQRALAQPGASPLALF